MPESGSRMLDPRYHHDSGRTTFAGRVMASVIASAGAIVAAFVYVTVTNILPFIYLDIILAFFFGAGVGLAVARGTRVGKIRSSRETTRMALMVTLLAYLLHWLLWLERVFARSDTPIAWNQFLLHPSVLWEAMCIVYENGTWAFTSHHVGAFGAPTPNVNGILLLLIWIGEAIAIFVSAWAVSTWWQDERAFCEHCNNWCGKPRLLHSYAGDVSGAEIKIHLEAKDWEFLGILPGWKRKEPTHIDLEYQQCPCRQTRVLNLQRVTSHPDRTGRLSTTKISLMERLIVTAEELNTIESIAPMSRVVETETESPPEDDYVDLGPT